MKKLLTLYKPTGPRELLLALVPWAVFFIIDLLVITLLYCCLHTSLGSLVTDAGRYRVWLPTLWSDMTVNYPGTAAAVALAGGVLLILVLLLSLFFSGGIYAIINDGGKSTPRALIKKSAEHFASMLRLALAAIPLWVVMALLPGLVFWLYYLLQKNIKSELLLLFFPFFWIPLALFFLIIGAAIFDYARIHLTEKDTGVFAAIKKGLATLRQQKAMTFFLFLSYFILAGVVLLLFSQGGSLLPVAGVFLLHQVSVLLRYYIKILFMKGEVTLCAESGSSSQ